MGRSLCDDVINVAFTAAHEFRLFNINAVVSGNLRFIEAVESINDAELKCRHHSQKAEK